MKPGRELDALIAEKVMGLGAQRAGTTVFTRRTKIIPDILPTSRLLGKF